MPLPLIGSSSNITSGVPQNAQSLAKKIARVEVDRDLCIGAESCVVVAPEVFEMDGENLAVVKNAKGSDDETILMAAQACPVAAILLYDEDGNQLYP